MEDDMEPDRKIEINGHKIEEFWAGEVVVYIDDELFECLEEDE